MGETSFIAVPRENASQYEALINETIDDLSLSLKKLSCEDTCTIEDVRQSMGLLASTRHASFTSTPAKPYTNMIFRAALPQFLGNTKVLIPALTVMDVALKLDCDVSVNNSNVNEWLANGGDNVHQELQNIYLTNFEKDVGSALTVPEGEIAGGVCGGCSYVLNNMSIEYGSKELRNQQQKEEAIKQEARLKSALRSEEKCDPYPLGDVASQSHKSAIIDPDLESAENKTQTETKKTDSQDEDESNKYQSNTQFKAIPIKDILKPITEINNTSISETFIAYVTILYLVHDVLIVRKSGNDSQDNREENIAMMKLRWEQYSPIFDSLIQFIDERARLHRSAGPFLAQAYYFYNMIELGVNPDNVCLNQLHGVLEICQNMPDAQSSILIVGCIVKTLIARSQFRSALNIIKEFPMGLNISNSLGARHLYYHALTSAMLFDYSDALVQINMAVLKSSTSSPSKLTHIFSIVALKLLIVTQLLQGQIPDRQVFCNTRTKSSLIPYSLLTSAVRLGNMIEYEAVMAEHSTRFEMDGLLILCERVRANVLNAGFRIVSNVFTRVTLSEIASRLGVTNDGDLLCAVRRAIADGIINGTLSADGQELTSTPSDNISEQLPADKVSDIIKQSLTLQEVIQQKTRFCTAGSS